jgi:hypothetical protein
MASIQEAPNAAIDELREGEPADVDCNSHPLFTSFWVFPSIYLLCSRLRVAVDSCLVLRGVAWCCVLCDVVWCCVQLRDVTTGAHNICFVSRG